MKNGRRLSLQGALEEIGCELQAMAHDSEAVPRLELWRLGRQLVEAGQLAARPGKRVAS